MTAMLVLGINEQTFIYINSLNSYSGEWIWPTLTIFGDPLIVVCIGLSFIHFQSKIAVSIFPAILLGAILVFSLKWAFGVSRPDLILEQGQFALLGTSPISPAFPSGHTTGIFTLATLVILFSKNHLINVVVLIFASFVAISRIMVGAHWPLDIGGGMVLGWGVALFAATISQSWLINTAKKNFIVYFLLFCSIILIFKDTGYPNAYPAQLIVAFYSLFIGLMKIAQKYTKTP